MPVKKSAIICSLFLPAFLSVCCFSCSLNYLQEPQDERSIPEFIFNSVRLTRVENAREIFTLTSEMLEQYKDDNSFFGTRVRFTSFNRDGVRESSGYAGAFSGSEKTGVYALLNGAKVTNYSENTEVSARSLRWDNRNETLVSGSGDLVTIRRRTGGAPAPEPSADEAAPDGTVSMEISGYGFAASGVTLDYRFDRTVNGWVVPQNDEGQER